MKKIIILLGSIVLTTIMQAQVSKTVHINTAGSLYTALTSTEKSTVTNLTITGTIDTRDFVTMRDSMNALSVLDISAVSIASYAGKGGTADSDWNVNNSYNANEIPKAAFYNLGSWKGKTSLTSVTIPSSTTVIGINAFESCSGLTTFIIPSPVTTISLYAFVNCTGLTTVTIPASVNIIGDCAFSNCKNLKSVYAYNTTPVAFDADFFVFYNVTTTPCVLYVPAGRKAVYETANQWKNFQYIVEMSGFSISADTASVTSSEGGTASVFVSCDKSWSAISSETWLTVTPGSALNGGTLVTFTASANTTTANRTAIVTITATGYTPQSIMVTQAFGGTSSTPTLSVSSNAVNIAKDVASTASIIVVSNATWVASSDQPWLLVNPDVQTTGNATVTFTALANTGTERTAIVTILTTGKLEKISVTQAAGNSTNLEIEQETTKQYHVVGNTVIFNNTQSSIYTFLGQRVSSGCKSVNLSNGIYIVHTPNGSDKIVILK